ncbi:MAG: Dyp-type peroxidase [Acidimicrobiia bacterium]
MTVPQPGILAQGTRTHHPLELWRRSTPWGTAGEQVLSFLAFSADPSRFHRMLERMFGATPDGLHDALTDFSEPQSAAIYFAPSVESLSALSAT